MRPRAKVAIGDAGDAGGAAIEINHPTARAINEDLGLAARGSRSKTKMHPGTREGKGCTTTCGPSKIALASTRRRVVQDRPGARVGDGRLGLFVATDAATRKGRHKRVERHRH